MILMRVAGLPYTTIYPTEAVETWPTIPKTDEAAQLVQEVLDALLASLPQGATRTQLYNARKAFYKSRKLPDSSLLDALDGTLRAALLEKLYNYSKTFDDYQRLETLYEQRLNEDLQRMQVAASGELFQRALVFASHDLLKQLPGFIQKISGEWNKKDRQIALSVYQYLSRAVFKTSPFSRFTTVGLLKPANPELDFLVTPKVSVTTNVALLPGIYEVLLREPKFYESLKLRPNPALQISDDEQHYTWLYFDGDSEAFQTTPVTPLIARLLQRMRDAGGTLGFKALHESLEAEVDAPADQLTSFVLELVSFGFLEWILPENGASPSWPGSLAVYLSHLSSVPLFTDTAFLLQNLRVSARAIPFQTPMEAVETQHRVLGEVSAYFEKYDRPGPDIQAEQLFYEDVERSAPSLIDSPMMQTLVEQLADCWRKTPQKSLPDLRSQLWQFAEAHLALDETMDFLSFCRLFMDAGKHVPEQNAATWHGKAGALLQVYQDGDQTRAVVNAMYPGGGKMFARWLHLFPADFKEQLQSWVDPEQVQFPWQGWTNANFQPALGDHGLLTPDGRFLHQASQPLPLSGLLVKRLPSGPALWHPVGNKPLVFNDLGLESPETKPPVIQILYALGVPFVSAAALVPPDRMAQPVPGGLHWPRVSYQSLVLARAQWSLACRSLTGESSAARNMVNCRNRLQLAGIPRFFFAKRPAPRAKPQFVDADSPLSMMLFEKMLKQDPEGEILITEMLPTPDQWVTGAFPEKYAAEFVAEFEV